MDENAKGADRRALPGDGSALIGAGSAPIVTTSEQDAKRREKIEALASSHRCAGTVTDLPPTASAGTTRPDLEC